MKNREKNWNSHISKKKSGKTSWYMYKKQMHYSTYYSAGLKYECGRL